MFEGLAGLLRWYAEMGVDIAVDDAQHDRFAESRASVSAQADELSVLQPRVRRRRSKPAAGPWPSRPRPFPPTPSRRARDQAAAAKDLADLREKLSRFEGCGLKATATRLVFGDGYPSADIMFIGEAPGADEDREGAAFRRPRGSIARQDAGRDRARPRKSLYRQCRALAAAWKPNADAA